VSDSEIIEAIATKVMGWTRSKPSGISWILPNGKVGRATEFPFPWNPLTNPADCKQVREKLAERAESIVIEWNNSAQSWSCQMWPTEESNLSFYHEARDAERAVALCALKSVGVEP
jgi:hypothetical protein